MRARARITQSLVIAFSDQDHQKVGAIGLAAADRLPDTPAEVGPILRLMRAATWFVRPNVAADNR
jgi:hypothetical protein